MVFLFPRKMNNWVVSSLPASKAEINHQKLLIQFLSTGNFFTEPLSFALFLRRGARLLIRRDASEIIVSKHSLECSSECKISQNFGWYLRAHWQIAQLKDKQSMSLVMCNIATSGNDNNNNSNISKNNVNDKSSVTIYRRVFPTILLPFYSNFVSLELIIFSLDVQLRRSTAWRNSPVKLILIMVNSR